MNVKAEGPSTMATDDYDCSPSVYLNTEQVEALGIKGMPAPGTVMRMLARVVVMRVSAEAEDPGEAPTEGGAPDVCLTFKLTDMEITQPSTASDIASALYS